MRPLKGWLTVKEIRDELRFTSDDAVRHWLRRQRITAVKRGRVILVDRFDLERALHVSRPASESNRDTSQSRRQER
jgi:hypothetical protein